MQKIVNRCPPTSATKECIRFAANAGKLVLTVGIPASKRHDFNVVLSFLIACQLNYQNHTRVPNPTVLTSLADHVNAHIDSKLNERYRISQKAILFHRYRICIDSAYSLYRAFATSSRSQIFPLYHKMHVLTIAFLRYFRFQ
jgi:hypothetical protein